MDRVIVKNLSKKFYIGHGVKQSPLKNIYHSISGRGPKKGFYALKDISLTVKSGEMIGIIGLNGAGKSTLLSLIGGIYNASSGTVTTNGKIISAIGLANGLNDRLTMRDNIYLCCSLFGIPRNSINKRMDSIINISSLSEYLDTKIYQFSEGMLDRLVFSIAVNSDPEILLFDEPARSMDRDHLEKGIQLLKKMVSQGVTIIVASHKTWAIEPCDRVIWIDKGKVKMSGESKEILTNYHAPLQ